MFELGRLGGVTLLEGCVTGFKILFKLLFLLPVCGLRGELSAVCLPGLFILPSWTPAL